LGRARTAGREPPVNRVEKAALNGRAGICRFFRNHSREGDEMKQLLTVLAAAIFAVVSVSAFAQDKPKAEKTEKSMSKDAPKKELTAAQKQRQERQKACSAQASEKKLKGDERKKFMSSCLKPAAKTAKPTAEKTKPMAEEKKK
jgi:hypothetical protein